MRFNFKSKYLLGPLGEFKIGAEMNMKKQVFEHYLSSTFLFQHLLLQYFCGPGTLK